MVNSLLIKNGRIIDPSQDIDMVGNLLIKNKKIAWIGSHKELPEANEYDVLDASGLIVCPGFIDFHCHLREPGFTDKETIATGTKAAAKGGFTTICCMANTRPPLDTAGMIDYVKEKSLKEGIIQVMAVGCITKGRKGKSLIYMEPLVKAGAIGFSDDGDTVKSDGLMQEALEISRMFNVPIIDHCESIIGGPPESEEEIVARDLSLAEKTGGWIHISHVSTAGAVGLIKEAKNKGVKVTAEATPHHLTLTKDIVKQQGTMAKVNPALRGKDDNQALIQGLKDGTIDIIATDHAPHTATDKNRDYAVAAAGISGFETALGSLMGLVHDGYFTINELVSFLTNKPAAILSRKLGNLATGSPADITIFSPDMEWTVDVDKFVSKGKNTPLAGARLKGKVMATIFQGNFVFKDNTLEIGLRTI